MKPTQQNASRVASLPILYKGIIPSSDVLSEEDIILCTQDPDSLHLNGFQIEIIAEVSKSMSWESLDPNLGLNIALSELVLWLSTRNDQIRSNDFLRSLARTLTAGQHLQAMATEREIDNYEDLLRLILDESGRPKHPKTASLSIQKVHEKEFLLTTQLWSGNRKIFSTKNGMLGL
jgi:hypothetical protein